MQHQPVGIFDSGIGGLSVLREIRKQLPHESLIYFADSANCPYGSREKAEALFLARKHINFLLELNCKLIVIACNTVTAVAINRFRSEYRVPFIGMEPALKPAVMKTESRKIGILATENTLNGQLFKTTFEKYAKDITVFIQPGYGLVELVEKGEHEGPKARRMLERYLLPMMDQGVDTIVLGCTHYPFFERLISTITQGKATVIDPADAVAAQTGRVLSANNLTSDTDRQPVFHFYTTGAPSIADKFLAETMDSPYRLECLAS